MSDDRPPGRPVSHRADTSPRTTTQRLWAPIAAVGVVVLVIVLLLVLNSHPHPDAGPALVSPSPSAAPSVAPTPTSASPTTPSASPASSTAPAPAPKRPVSVLNNSRRSGLAHRVADQVAAHGWPVATVGNFTGQVAASTLYYGHGQLASARRLAHELPAIRRVLPRFESLPGSGLTLVVTRDWPA